ncbi:hypothetical protein DsansV1_C13g0122651 [Dioscorea sansibarensis]
MATLTRNRSGGAERVLLSMLELSVVDAVLAAGKSLLWSLSVVHALSRKADGSLKVGEIIKGLWLLVEMPRLNMSLRTRIVTQMMMDDDEDEDDEDTPQPPAKKRK